MTTDTQDYTNDDFQKPLSLDKLPPACDLVMKGGITSGVVYPPAILKLATQYCFRSIGGTSAGAIAAAATAAAEYNRKNGGFVKLYKIQKQLNEKDFVRYLFQPSKESQPALETLLAVAGEKAEKPDVETQESGQKMKKNLWFLLPLRVRQFLKLQESFLLHDPKVVAAGALVGTSLPYGWAWLVGGSLNQGRRIIPLLSGWLGAQLAGVLHLGWILSKRVPRDENFYGMCIGHKDTPGGPDVLTDWLSDQINDLAGKPCWRSDKMNEFTGKPLGNPLTFGDLANKQPDGEGINLQLVATNLSHSEPYIFPRAEMNLVFKEDEMRKFFPAYVVDYMVWAARQKSQSSAFLPEQRDGARSLVSIQQEKSQGNEIVLPKGYYFLPAWLDLPVIVATRMSLSFPILLCAVPLYTIDSSASANIKQGKPLKETDLQKNWFSDGGICSNFPIHFFDAWLPRHPTFGINLTSLPKQPQSKDQQDGISRSVAALSHDAPTATHLNQRVFLPRAKDPLDPEYSQIQGLAGFIGAITRTMQNYRDNTQAQLPSYRERIVQIRFDKDREGGLNLAMDPDTIQRIACMGEQAAEKLLPGSDFNFEEHMWVRLRVLMAQLEERFEGLEKGYPNIHTYEQLLEEQLKHLDEAHSPFYCSEDQQWCEEAIERLKAMIALIDCWKQADDRWMQSHPNWPDTHFFAAHSPAPQPILRTTPNL